MSIVKYVWERITADGVPLARSSHEVSLIGDCLYVFGGENIARTPIDSSFYKLTLSADNLHWDKINASGTPPSPRIAHAQCVVGNTIWIFGGRDEVSMGEGCRNDLYSFNTENNTWNGPISYEGCEPPPVRSFHKMISVNDDLFVFGGCGTVGRLNDLYTYDTLSNVWKALPVSDRISGRGGPCFATVLQKTSLLVAGGYSGQENNDLHVYDIASQEWREITAPVDSENSYRARSVAPHCPVAEGAYVMIVGGEVNTSDIGHDGAGDFASDVVFIDCSTGAVIPSILGECSEQPLPRGWTSMAALSTENNSTYSAIMFGGLSGNDDAPMRLDDIWKVTATLETQE